MAWSPQWKLVNLPQGTLHGRRSATMQERQVWTTDAEARRVARECCYITGPFSMPRLAVMTNEKPSLIFAPYLKSIQNPVNGAPATIPNQWYQHYMDGVKVQQAGAFKNWLMESGFHPSTRIAATVKGRLSGVDLTVGSWGVYQLRDAVAKVSQTNALPANAGAHPFKSLWLDSMGTFSADSAPGFWTGTNRGKNPTTAQPYTKTEWLSMVHYMGDLARNLGVGLADVNPERLFVGANGLRGVGGGSAAGNLPEHVDLAMTEGWLIKGLGSTVKTQTVFEDACQMMLDCQLVAGAVAEPIENGTAAMTLAQQTQCRRWTAGANLLCTRGLMTFEYGDDQGTPAAAETAKDPDLYAMDLGTPLAGQSPAAMSGLRVAVGAANGQASATGLYARLYDGGTVLVNITGSAINYKASKTYTRVPSLQSPATTGYVAGNLIPVPAGSAEFFTTTSGPVDIAPSFSAVPDVSGTVQEGQTLVSDQGTVTGSPTPTVASQWQQSASGTASWTAITGEVNASFLIPTGTGGTPTTYAADDFSDTQVDTWASADTGGAWLLQQGATADLDKTSGRGTFSHGAANTAKSATLNIAQADADGKVTVSFPAVAAGGNMQASLMLRWADVSNYLRINLVLFASGGHLNANPDKVVTGTATSLGTAKDLGVYTAGADVTIRLRVEGNNIKGKAWLTAGSEPGAWDWDVTDSSLTAAGQTGLRAFRGASNTNTSPQTRFDNLTVTSLGGTGGTSYVGKFLRDHATAINRAGTETADSAAVGPVIAAGSGSPPAWTAQPSISGNPAELDLLTLNTGTITGTPTPTLTEQWETSATGNAGSWSNISGETGLTYGVPAGAAGSYKRAKVTAQNTGGTVSAWAAKVGPIIAGDTPPSFSASPTLAGTAVAGSALTRSPGTVTGSPTPTLVAQWQHSADSGASWLDLGVTAVTFTPSTGLVGHLIRVEETATNRAGQAIAASASKGPVEYPVTFPDFVLTVVAE